MKNPDSYFIGVMDSVAEASSCIRGKVGAVFVSQEQRILVTGYNGTPSGWPNCNEGGCARCDSDALTGDYRGCNCLHAETNALVTAARHGVSLEWSTVYLPFEPCHACTLFLAQAGVAHIVCKESRPKDAMWVFNGNPALSWHHGLTLSYWEGEEKIDITASGHDDRGCSDESCECFANGVQHERAWQEISKEG